MPSTDVTTRQRAMLVIMNPARKQDPARWYSGEKLLPLLAGRETTQGVHRTAASLVRRGYLARRTVGSSYGKVVYAVTGKGREMVAALASLDKLNERRR